MDYAIEATTISVVVPCYNSENTVAEVAMRSADSIRALGYEPEIILVNDCSSDGTLGVISDLARSAPFITAIDFAKNYGQHNALLAGIRNSTGAFVIGIDDDLQTPPEEIPKLINLLLNGADLAFGIPDEAQYQAYRSLGSRFNRCCACFLTDRPAGIHTSSFWAAKRFVVDEAARQNNPLPQIQSAFFEATKKVETCVARHDARAYGRSGYSFKKLVKQWGRLLGYSSKPLDVMAAVSLIAVLVACVLALLGAHMGAFETMGIAVLFILGAIIIVDLALVGVYLGRTLQILRGRPSYVIREIIR